MKDRIKSIRRNQRLSQEQFGNRLGIKKSSVSLLESGKNSPSEQTIKLICSEFSVNEDWLRTGEGEPFIKRTRNQLITDFLGDVIKDDDESFRKRLVEVLAKLDVEDWEYLAKLSVKLTKKD